ncbi:hypothetical protein ACHAXT_009686 [Thalassiosira profunda]
MPITQPSPRQFRALFSDEAALDRPVDMLNILKFRRPAEYAEYARQMEGILKGIRARVVYQGTIAGLVIGDEEKFGGRHHAVAIVRYPTRRSFVDMMRTPAFREAHRHREAGLESQWLVACEPAEDAVSSFLEAHPKSKL